MKESRINLAFNPRMTRKVCIASGNTNIDDRANPMLKQKNTKKGKTVSSKYNQKYKSTNKSTKRPFNTNPLLGQQNVESGKFVSISENS